MKYIRNLIHVFFVLVITACGSDGSNLDITPDINPSLVIKLERAYPDLSFNRPVSLLSKPDSNDRWYVVEQGGRIFWFDATDENTAVKNTYLDFSGVVDDRGEGGLLDMAFHPNFNINKQVFLSYTVTANIANNELISRITRLTENADGSALSATVEDVILEQNQFATNHNGGHLAFGADNNLYIGFGDGGGGGDPQENAQNTQTLLGALLRIDVDSAFPYATPTDNPFAGSAGRPEIYAYGLRNPWRWSFDKATGDLWLGDVGQNEREEINRIVKGGNYGWDCFEGSALFESAGCPQTSQLIFPVAEYDHSEGFSVTGGYVYRGNAIPELQGIYLFGDFVSGTIWGLFPNGGNSFERRIVLNSQLSIVSFAQANNGELFVVDYTGGLYRIVSTNE
jgi:glucose/arabinose dehydrogenase